MRNRRPLATGLLASMLTLIGACTTDPATAAGEHLAASIRIDGYRKIFEKQSAETTVPVFVGPANVDLMATASARNWRPEPSPDWRDDASIDVISQGRADTDGFICHVVLSLRPCRGDHAHAAPSAQ